MGQGWCRAGILCSRATGPPVHPGAGDGHTAWSLTPLTMQGDTAGSGEHPKVGFQAQDPLEDPCPSLRGHGTQCQQCLLQPPAPGGHQAGSLHTNSPPPASKSPCLCLLQDALPSRQEIRAGCGNLQPPSSLHQCQAGQGVRGHGTGAGGSAWHLAQLSQERGMQPRVDLPSHLAASGGF